MLQLNNDLSANDKLLLSLCLSFAERTSILFLISSFFLYFSIHCDLLLEVFQAMFCKALKEYENVHPHKQNRHRSGHITPCEANNDEWKILRDF